MKIKAFLRNPIVLIFPIFCAAILPGKMVCRLAIDFVIAARLPNHLPATSAIIRTDFVQKTAPLATFKALSHSLMDAVQSGNGRTALASQETDFYPVPLKREELWPGTIYADPYGHVLILTKWVAKPQRAQEFYLRSMPNRITPLPENDFGKEPFYLPISPVQAPVLKHFDPLRITAC